ncbi:unnamed protein product, partial [Vitis vinifera]|uniref:Uncharacterized protein n=1 Tax=Vitis vinifera TaxID=29760 RepID=D7TNQ1_VITVI
MRDERCKWEGYIKGRGGLGWWWRRRRSSARTGHVSRWEKLKPKGSRKRGERAKTLSFSDGGL